MAPPVTEARLLEEILALAARRGVYAVHVPDSRRVRGEPGFPDLFLAGPMAAAAWELKTVGGNLSRHQLRWKYRLEAAGIRYCMIRPADLSNGLVDFEMASLITQPR